ncbi:C2H2-type domain-containing protein [Psidium guajava]|nr:C2H2-type domain-containing protein [Psidium guajava]
MPLFRKSGLSVHALTEGALVSCSACQVRGPNVQGLASSYAGVAAIALFGPSIGAEVFCARRDDRNKNDALLLF